MFYSIQLGNVIEFLQAYINDFIIFQSNSSWNLILKMVGQIYQIQLSI